MTDNTYVIEEGANYQYLDPQVEYFAFDNGIMLNSYESLLWWNGTNAATPIPWLASNMTQVNPSTYTFGLRQGIKFQDGTPFNSTAVCFSFNRDLILDGGQPTGDGASSGWILQQLTNTKLFTFFGGSPDHSHAWVDQVLALNFCQTLGTYKVQINLLHPTGAFPIIIAGTGWGSIMSPSFVVAHDDPAAIQNGVVNMTAYYDHQAGNGTTYLNAHAGMAGTGPYEISYVNPTTYEVKLTANSNYWGGPPGYQFGTIKPSIQTIDFLTVSDASTRILDLKGGHATQVAVPAPDIFSILDRAAYDANGSYISAQSNIMTIGPHTYYNTGWFEFNVNVTNSAGQLLSFQPFTDIRFRLALSDAANVTSDLQSLTFGLDAPATWMFPPGTLPVGSYNSTAKLGWGYNLTTAANLLKSACSNPLTSFTYFNGTAIPAGVINNSCSGQTIPLYYQSSDVVTQKILTEAAANLNIVSAQNNLGVTFTVVPVPAGTLYTLAGEHQIYGYWAGWLDDYNWAIDWTGPMFSSTGTYPYWSQWNFTSWNNLVNQAAVADQNGNTAGILAATQALGASANHADWFWFQEYSLDFHFVSTWVHNWVYNSEYVPDQFPYFAIMSFGAPSS